VISLRIELNDLAATQRLGTIIAHHLRAGDRLLLIGEIGSGKTTLARAIGSALHADPPLTSPTFLLVSEHQGTLPIWHADAYRLPPGSDPLAAGLIDERHAAGVTIVEWPEQVRWPLQGEGSSLLEVELTPGAHDDARGATLRIGDAERARSLHAAVLAAGIEAADAS
jgi:tRNA threonylcarbamoyl adenosine modification protein YjeE